MSTVALASCLAQALLTLHPSGAGPLRFGYPLPERVLSDGLRAEGSVGLRLQWRALQQRPDPVTGRVWVEIVLVGAQGRVRILRGGEGPVEPAEGLVARRQELPDTASTGSPESPEAPRGPEAPPGPETPISAAGEGPADECQRIRWRFADGTEDAIDLRRFLRTAEHAGERFAAGETLTRYSEGVVGRFSRAGVPARAWRVAGVLEGRGDAGREIRGRLLDAVDALVEGRGLRDVGDYRRSGEVWTNLEFDSALGFARLGLAEAKGQLLERAWRAAVHVADRDLDPRTGLCFPHGKEHRTAAPDPGHTWLEGMLLVGCLAADDRLIATAGCIARGLALHPVDNKGRQDRVRDAAWPLSEMEAWLRFAADERVEQACDRLVARLLLRFDARNGVLRFGEGVRRRGVYEEPLWVTAGCLLPGLRRHHRRTSDRRVGTLIDALEKRLVGLLRAGVPGLPLRYRVAGGRVFGVVRVEASASGFLLLEGLSERTRRQCLDRSLVRDALGDLPRADDPDFATTWSMLARCAWIYR